MSTATEQDNSDASQEGITRDEDATQESHTASDKDADAASAATEQDDSDASLEDCVLNGDDDATQESHAARGEDADSTIKSLATTDGDATIKSVVCTDGDATVKSVATTDGDADATEISLAIGEQSHHTATRETEIPHSEDHEQPAAEQAPSSRHISQQGHEDGVIVSVEELGDPDVESGRGRLTSTENSSDVVSSKDDELVEATPVEDDQDDAFIPSAVRYDLEAKPPVYRRKRFLLWALLLATAVVALAVALAITLGGDDIEPKERHGADEIRAEIEAKVDSKAWEDDELVYTRSIEWIIDEDPKKLSAEDPHLVQRFLLAVFYFLMHKSGQEWLSCDVNPEDSFCYFKDLRSVEPVLEYRAIGRQRWLSDSHECSWGGVTCNGVKEVIGVGLSGQHIIGRLPIVLSYFPKLQTLNLGWNQLTGTIPEEYANHPDLVQLDLHYNDLSGVLPEHWSNATNLQSFNVGGNAMISGTLPDDFGRLPQLEALFLFNTNMKGPIHSQIAQLSLVALRVGYTQLSGTLPTEIGQMPLHELWMENSLIGGTIPSEIGLTQGMKDLRLHGSNIHGTIPEELWNIESLVRLDLHGTNIGGTLSPKVAKLTTLTTLRVSDTSLGGRVPTEISSLTLLRRVWLQETGFTGEVPPGLCDFMGEDEGDELIADCLGTPQNDEKPMISCQCCTECCNPADGYCE